MDLSGAYRLDAGDVTAQVEGVLFNQETEAGYFLKVTGRLPGWFDTPGVRGTRVELAWDHGEFEEEAKREARVITIDFTAYLPTQDAAVAAYRDLTGLLAEGGFGTLTVTDPLLGTHTARVRLLTSSPITWTMPGIFRAQIQLLAPNPRKYGTTVTALTGSPAPGGGLRWPLFSGGRGALLRTNYATNPYGVNAYSVYTNDGRSSVAPNIAVTGNPDGITTANRVSWLANANNPGALFFPTTETNTSYTVSAWVYVETAGTGLGFAQSGVAGSSALTVAPGQWTRLSWTYTTGTSTNGIGLRYAGVQAGSGSFLITGVFVEKSSSLSTFFGARTIRKGYSYGWTGVADASVSQEYALVRNGVLDFGTPGSTGRVMLTNAGNAVTKSIRATVQGPVSDGFTITQTGTDRRLQYDGEILAGQYLSIDARTGTVRLDGYSDRATNLVRRDWPALKPGETAEFLFEAPGSPDARLTLEADPAWW